MCGLEYPVQSHPHASCPDPISPLMIRKIRRATDQDGFPSVLPNIVRRGDERFALEDQVSNIWRFPPRSMCLSCSAELSNVKPWVRRRCLLFMYNRLSCVLLKDIFVRFARTVYPVKIKQVFLLDHSYGHVVRSYRASEDQGADRLIVWLSWLLIAVEQGIFSFSKDNYYSTHCTGKRKD